MPLDDDDNDICPVCDRECTCHLRPVAAQIPQQPNKPSLKIRLTVPQSMLAKRPTRAKEATIDDPDSSSTAETPPPQPKRRGRPPKPTRSAINRKAVFIKQKTPLTKSRLAKDKQAAAAAAAALSRKVTAAKKRGRDRSETVDSHDTYDDNDDQFPTFVSASALSSLSSESDSSSSDAFETDSEIEAEEEKFIIDQVRDKARVRRELLGDDGQARRSQNNNWVIRPRKKSVGPSDGEMDIDSDATADDDNDDEDEDEDEDEADGDEETDGRGVGAGYVGLATGWSEDDESSFDADLFFANLSASDSSSTPTSGAEDDADESDMDSVSAVVTDLLPHLRHGLENLPFEVTESWDGQIVFTNGLRDGQGALDIDFEIDAAQFMVESSPSSGDGDSDINMIHSDRGYEEDLDGGEGDTTDEELVGENDLPNERAMQLFSFPFSVSAINPLSTVSPSVSPCPLSRRPFPALLSSPKPADILAGRVFWESDELDDLDDAPQKGTGPRKGCFLPNSETRTAIIDDSHNSVPSPHPSFRRHKSRRSDVGFFAYHGTLA